MTESSATLSVPNVCLGVQFAILISSACAFGDVLLMDIYDYSMCLMLTVVLL
jgi:hypothetical protein